MIEDMSKWNHPPLPGMVSIWLADDASTICLRVDGYLQRPLAVAEFQEGNLASPRSVTGAQKYAPERRPAVCIYFGPSALANLLRVLLPIPLHSPMFPFCCLWMTTACANLCPLTLECRGAWRFSTNSDQQHSTSWPIRPLPNSITSCDPLVCVRSAQMSSIYRKAPSFPCHSHRASCKLVRRQCIFVTIWFAFNTAPFKLHLTPVHKYIDFIRAFLVFNLLFAALVLTSAISVIGLSIACVLSSYFFLCLTMNASGPLVFAICHKSEEIHVKLHCIQFYSY